jgi:CDP-glycerol glycerophosphotransferase
MRLDRFPALRRFPRAFRSVRPDAALFESWHGAYSDNPRAISEELARRGSGLERIWAVEAGVPGATAAVAPGSRRYLEALGTARYLVSNISLPGYFRKRPGTTYVQTWHGTPLKRIAFDIANPDFPSRARYLAGLERDVAKWDVLLSPNRFSTDVFRQAFRYDGQILETGYPRNDALLGPGAGATRSAVRSRLGIPDGARAVLYAPTWRDGSAFELALDVHRVRGELGDDHVLLLRMHHLAAAALTAQQRAHALDVSSYPDITDLYLAADVLVTDYSSAMFDFAVTRKPMVFFTYDLASYRDEVRGFYFDFEQEAPGPLLATTGDVCEALRDLGAVSASYAAGYKRFTERFCHLDNGRAAARVVDAVFATGTPS